MTTDETLDVLEETRRRSIAIYARVAELVDAASLGWQVRSPDGLDVTMLLIRRAIREAPDAAKALLREVVVNDEKITAALRDLVLGDDVLCSFCALEPKTSGWIACADRLPELTYHAGDTVGVVRSENVLVYAPGEVEQTLLLDLVRVHDDCDATWEGDGPDELGTSLALGEVTHWRPLPEPPK